MQPPPAMMRIGSLSRSPLFLHWTAPLLVVGILILHSWDFVGGFGNAVGAVIVIFVHELGHATIVRMCRQRVEWIALYGWGGECAFSSHGLTTVERSLIAWGGVLAQGAVCGVARIVQLRGWLPAGAFVDGLLVWLTAGNLVMIALNLFPWPGLDGYLAWPLPYHLLRGLRARRVARQTIDRALKKSTATDRRGLRVIDGGKKR